MTAPHHKETENIFTDASNNQAEPRCFQKTGHWRIPVQILPGGLLMQKPGRILARLNDARKITCMENKIRMKQFLHTAFFPQLASQ